MGGTAGATAAAAKSWPQFGQAVSPFFTFSPQAGHSRPFGLVMNQISEKNAKPKKPMNSTRRKPIPVPASQPSRAAWLASDAQSLEPAALIAQTKISTDQMMSTHVILRQCGLLTGASIAGEAKPGVRN